MEYKEFDFKFSTFDEAKGIFEGSASVYGNVDLQNEVIDAGAFTKSIEANGGEVPILMGHMIHDVLGGTQAIKDSTRKMGINAQFDLNVQRAKEVYSLMKNGFLKGLSVGFITKKDSYVDGIRHVVEADLKEISVTAFPANPKALVDAVKEVVETETKAGRVLSGANLEKVRAAIGALQAVLDVAEPPTPPEKSEAADLEEKAEPVFEQKPYPNEHSFRIKEPSAFEPESFRRVTRKHEGKNYSVIMGKLKGSTSMSEQAYRYPTSEWDADAAKAHCTDHEGRFEAAAPEKSEPCPACNKTDVVALTDFDYLFVDSVKQLHQNLSKQLHS